MSRINVTGIFLWEKSVQFVHLVLHFRPTLVIFRHVYYLKPLRLLVQKVIHLRNSGITAGTLQPPFVFQPRIAISSTVSVAFRTVKPVEQRGRGEIVIERTGAFIVPDTYFRPVYHLTTRQYPYRSIQYFTEFVNVNVNEMRIPSPTTPGIAVGCCRSGNFTGHFYRNGFRTVDNGLSRQHDMFHDRHRSGSFYERFAFLIVFSSRVTIVRTPSASIETNTVLSGIPAEPCPEAITLDVEKTILHRVLLTTDEVFRMLRQ